ncbi:MAG TPA: SAM-dependent methyltransferase, partial [Candidatus Rifleibacterium sp.]|nr:SAM-dependent methyltransferase [Candidatus Rifleibacterium sp.]
NYEQGLKDLEGFDRVWLLYVFHHNSSWKPLTNPPYSDGQGRKGVFATRSPYRPNPLGLSCVELKRISGNRVYVAG